MLERDNDAWIKSLEHHNSPKYNVNNIKNKYLDYEWLNNRDSLITEKINWKMINIKQLKNILKIDLMIY